MLRGKFKGLNAYTKKEERLENNELRLHLKKSETDKFYKSRRKMKIRVEINTAQNKHPIKKINKFKMCIFEKISESDRYLVRLIEKKRWTQISNKKNVRGHQSRSYRLCLRDANLDGKFL